VKWHGGRLWIAALRQGGILRVDPDTWCPKSVGRLYRSPHGSFSAHSAWAAER
jgi:hypothetical protein